MGRYSSALLLAGLLVAVASLGVSKASAQTFNCTIPIPTLQDQMIRESIQRYPGNCPCPYNSDRAGRRCGGRSAWSRPGGYSPLCYPSDISPDMIREFCEVLKMRGQGR